LARHCSLTIEAIGSFGMAIIIGSECLGDGRNPQFLPDSLGPLGHLAFRVLAGYCVIPFIGGPHLGIVFEDDASQIAGNSRCPSQLRLIYEICLSPFHSMSRSAAVPELWTATSAMRLSAFIVSLVVVATAGCASRPLYFPTSEEQYNEALREAEPPPQFGTNSGWQIFHPGDYFGSWSWKP